LEEYVAYHFELVEYYLPQSGSWLRNGSLHLSLHFIVFH
jgi:hypothetical protein